MTDTKNQPAAKAPTHICYHVRDGKKGTSFWTRIGVAWAHNDGQGFNIEIAVAPLDGRITLRTATEQKD